MKLHNPIQINKWLLPFSWLYGIVVSIRNKFFKWGIYKQKVYDLPVICVGNITVGGTGKTPHTEYLIRLLKDKYNIAILSRGYKRRTNGFILSTIDSTSSDIGDEPYQIKQKFPEIMVAVDRDRRRGIEKLLALDTSPDVIILDDGFQHRYVKPSYSIILSDFNRPVYEDKLLPAGRLREPAHYLRLASDIIITKCPETLLPLEYRLIAHDINPFPFQGLFYTTFTYKKLNLVFESDHHQALSLDALSGKSILLVTGIASPKPLVKKLMEHTADVVTIEYEDHYIFTDKDVKTIETKYNSIEATHKIIVVTEKDAGRLKLLTSVSDAMKSILYYIPIEVSFLEGDHQKEFNKRILKHVKENRRNS